jgi:iron(III) transport system ATP-binding protein
MVFQSYALFPHLDVYENVAVGLKSRGAPPAEFPERVRPALRRVDLVGYERRSVQALSGGQQQRVALARALAPEPPLLLLDEPLSNLDAALRERTRDELRAVLKEVGITAVFVTHDQEEAFALSDRIAVLRSGRLEQLGAPEVLYHSPASAFVASFVGRANFLPARLLETGPVAATAELPGGVRWPVTVADDVAPGPARVMARPEALVLLPPAVDGPALRGRVIDRRFAGAVTYHRVGVEGIGEVTATGGAAEPGAEVDVGLADGARVHAFPPEAE